MAECLPTMLEAQGSISVTTQKNKRTLYLTEMIDGPFKSSLFVLSRKFIGPWYTLENKNTFVAI